MYTYSKHSQPYMHIAIDICIVWLEIIQICIRNYSYKLINVRIHTKLIGLHMHTDNLLA